MIKSSSELFFISVIFMLLFILVEKISYKLDSKKRLLIVEIIEAIFLFCSTISLWLSVATKIFTRY